MLNDVNYVTIGNIYIINLKLFNYVYIILYAINLYSLDIIVFVLLLSFILHF